MGVPDYAGLCGCVCSREYGMRVWKAMCLAMKWCSNLLSGHWVFRPPAGYREMEVKLKERVEEPRGEWNQAGFEYDEVLPLLKIIEDYTFWPNHHFYPQDMIAPLLSESIDEFASHYLFQELEEKYSVYYSNEDIARMNTWTVGDLINDVFEKM